MEIARGCPIGAMPYTIKEGDSLYTIAQEHNTTIDILLRINHGLEEDFIPAGVTICVPMDIEICPGELYEVQEGDRLYEIAERYNLRVIDIIRNNPFIDVYNLMIGTRLCIPIPTQDCQEGDRIYIYQEGDTITTILEKFDLSFQEFYRANEHLDLPRLTMGDRICIPDKKGFNVSRSGKEYIIGMGEDIYGLSSRFRVSVGELLIDNPKFSPSDFISGRVISLPVRAREVF
ncbi:LysM domain-containing protein [Natranaerovirga pectinivora]|uniref:LysM domain-containing protein n=1 Tax=Natranaerovirga pectinivora TaxID=682400 RepID=A0A4V2V0L5_9FIRM|nr:LysM peptidoglycan-binding domain-containing protein [Natranaerovirga pectinivora]TCT16809.1 LysM domain-containing protein [Natranaerovirga pectinivora]